MTFKELVERAYSAHGCVSLTAAATALGWSKGRLSNYLEGRRPVEVEHLDHIARTFKTTIAAIVPDSGPVADVVNAARDAAAVLSQPGEAITVSAGDLRAVLSQVLLVDGVSEARAEMLAQLVPEILRLLPTQPEGVRGGRRVRRAWKEAATSLGHPLPSL